MTALETAIAIPLVFWLLFALLLTAPRLYAVADASAAEAVASTCETPATRPDGWIRAGLALGDSAAILSEWVPGLGDALSILGGQREGA